VSVSSHLGGALTGMLVGMALSRGWLHRSEVEVEPRPSSSDNGDGDGGAFLN
jgi:hypothetical protein